MEEWKEVPGYPGFKASSLGRVLGKTGREVGSHTGAYVTIGLYHNGSSTTVNRSRMVCLAFHGIPPFEGAEADHINRDKYDDRPENLRWADHTLQNMNKGLQRNSTTGIRGLHWVKPVKPTHHGHWKAAVKHRGRRIVKHFHRDYKEDAIEWLANIQNNLEVVE